MFAKFTPYDECLIFFCALKSELFIGCTLGRIHFSTASLEIGKQFENENNDKL